MQPTPLIAICCSDPLQGRTRWTIKLLTKELVSRKIVISIAKETVRSKLNQIELQPWKTERFWISEEDLPRFMFVAPIKGWRRVSNRPQRTRLDWAEEIKQLLDEDYPDAPMIKLVCDNLNTHHIGCLYHAFPAETAHRLARRLLIHHTPRNGSWLNIAETELSVLSQQCLDRRISRADLLKTELAAWQQERNQEHAKVKWQFTTADARIKLLHLYPQF